jgi:acyl-CoA hydrolase
MLRFAPTLVGSVVGGGARTAAIAPTLLALARCAADQAKLVVGANTHVPARSAAASRTRFNDIVGQGAPLSSAPQRVSAGELLELIDAAAADCAARHVLGAKVADPAASSAARAARGDDGDATPHRSASVTTVSMAEIKLQTPIFSGDFFTLSGQVVDVGSSSVAVHVSVAKTDFPTVPGERRESHVADAFTSFVAIGEDLRPLKIVPPVVLDSDGCIAMHHRMRKLQARYRASLTEAAAVEQMTLAECRDEAARLRAETAELFRGTAHDLTRQSGAPAVSMEASTLVANRFFLRGAQNMHGAIFGGLILNWAEVHASYAARRFACNPNVVTLALHGVQFHEPIFYTDAVSLRARVVNVRNSTVEIDCEVFVDRADGRRLTSNRVGFVCVSLDTAGRPRPIGVDLDMTSASLDEYVAHVTALRRYLRLAKERKAACRL